MHEFVFPICVRSAGKVMFALDGSRWRLLLCFRVLPRSQMFEYEGQFDALSPWLHGVVRKGREALI